jgi:NAD(P)-dependent dehydrogenase (short-subunit alcohol dehydrogenase family)
MFSLKGKVALVTGASRGIGRAIACGLAEQGADIIAVGRSASGLADIATQIGKLTSVLQFAADIGKLSDIDALTRAALDRFGKIDVLVNNAALGGPLRATEAVTPEEFDELMDVNLRGTFFLTNAVARSMMKSGGGSIINISSIAAETAAPRAAVYSAAKGALNALTLTLAVEWARHGIRVNGIAPGYIKTDLTEAMEKDDKVRQYVTSRTPLGRMADPSELVGLAVYLASNEASFQTGTTIRVDGGWSSW